MAGVPFKVSIPCRNVKVGVVAQSLEHLHSLLEEKFGLAGADIQITLEDGTIICNEEYFNLLEPQTNMVVSPLHQQQVQLLSNSPHPAAAAASVPGMAISVAFFGIKSAVK